MKKAIICFTRVPVAGKTKTRLMPRLSGDDCAGLHGAFLKDLACVYRLVEAELFVAYAPDGPWQELMSIFPQAKEYFPQSGDSLGERMDAALKHVFSLGFDACVLTGADLPLLTADHVNQAFAALERSDVVLGPTSDGGYYLVGAKEPSPFLFAGQSYGSGSVFDNTAAAAAAAGKSFSAIKACDDVDTPEDLEKLKQLVPPQSHTAAFLRSLDL